jgi:hypothetical protein
MTRTAHPQAEERVNYDIVWDAVRKLLPRANDETRSHLKGALFSYLVQHHRYTQVPKATDARPYSALANMLSKLVKHIHTMETGLGARSVERLINDLRLLGLGNDPRLRGLSNLSISIPRFVSDATLLRFAAQLRVNSIRSLNKGKVGSPRQDAKRAFVRKLRTIWRRAGIGKPTSDNPRFLDFVEKMNVGLSMGLKLGTREAIGKLLQRLQKKLQRRDQNCRSANLA